MTSPATSTTFLLGQPPPLALVLYFIFLCSLAFAIIPKRVARKQRICSNKQRIYNTPSSLAVDAVADAANVEDDYAGDVR